MESRAEHNADSFNSYRKGERAVKEDGVSPVVGVMLMLVVTIVLAAVLGTFASGMFTDSGNLVRAEIVFAEKSGDDYIFEMKSGEPFLLSDIKLVYSLRENASVYDSVSFNGGTVSVDKCRFAAPMPNFTMPQGSHLTYSFFDIAAGTMISAGEVLIP